MFVSEENEGDRVEMEFEMPDTDKLQKVYLREIRDSRLQKEAEARRAAEEKHQAELRRQETERKRREEEARVKEQVFNVGGVEFKMIRVRTIKHSAE